MKIKLLSLVFLLFAANQLFSQSSISATARIFENSSKDASNIFVVYNDGTDETIPLQNLPGFGMAKASSKVLLENQKIIQIFLKDMEEKGHQIADISSSSEAFIYTLIIFKKE
jgi:hypothetical protein